MPINYDKIEETLTKFEGKRVVRGYIPCNCGDGKARNYYGGENPSWYTPMGVSGVTIATGVDLGQTDIATLQKIGVSESTILVLRPYIKKSCRAAVNALHDQPLVITEAQAEELDRCMHRYHVGLIEARYNRDAQKLKFADLPWQAQAVIVSILYQRGCGSPKKFPNTWKALCECDWKDAAQRFMNKSLWTGYHYRRTEEGKILSTIE